METIFAILGFVGCAIVILAFMLFVLYLIRKDIQSETKKLDLIHKKLMDLKYR